jgi:gamma-glutamylcyclotransferase (GGCT)/AIG2-like uncharacterized protein YtfP
LAPEATGAANRDPVSIVMFVYGTLAPGQQAWPLIAPYVTHRTENAVPGTLFDTGRGYPAAVFAPNDDVVRGWCCRLADPPLDDLDAFEGDEYERMTVRCVDGTEAIAYHWIASLAGCRPVASGSWDTGP